MPGGVYTIEDDHASLALLANRALAEAAKDKTRFPEPINWGDLRCVNVERFSLTNKACGRRIYIEEAHNHCPALSKFGADYIRRNGYPKLHTEVCTEW